MSDIVIGPAPAQAPAGDLTRLEILQRGNPVRVLDGWADITFIVEWELNPAANALAAATGSDWEVQLLAESIGDGFEGVLHTGSLANNQGVYDPVSAMFKFRYEGQVTAPVPEEHGPAAGVYRLAGTLFIDGATPYLDMVAFDEMRLIMHEPLH